MSNRIIRAVFLNLFFVVLLFKTGYTQTSQSQNRSNTFLRQSAVSASDQIYFIDELSLQILEAGSIPSDYVTPGYILGPNDLISVHVTGTVPVTARGLIVNSQGDIFLPLAGQVNIGGLTLEKATEEVRAAFREQLAEFELNLTIERPREVSVHLVGDIANPGRYRFPAGIQTDSILKTIKLKTDRESQDELNQSQKNRPFRQQPIPVQDSRINILDAEGDQIAEDESLADLEKISLRNLNIIRADSTVTKADIIRYRSTGEIKYNPYVYAGDVIVINLRNENTPRVSISGAVQRPDEFEYRSDDTIQTLLKIGGGRLDDADLEQVFVIPADSRERMTITAEDFTNYILRPNDRVIVPFNRSEKITSGARITGEIEIPGIFPISERSATLADLLEMSGGLKENALPNAAYIIRNTSTIRETENVTDINIDALKRTSDQLRQGFEYLELEEQLGTQRKIFVDLSKKENLKDIRILDGDHLYVPRDLQAVVLFGQVNNPGNYPYNSNYTVQDYLRQAGGLSLAADQERVFVIKAGSKAWLRPGETLIESGDMIFTDRIPFDELDSKRNHELQVRSAKRQDLQVLLATISTIAAVVTTAVVVTRR
jgi:polysaccharide biosynthesis/export protein